MDSTVDLPPHPFPAVPDLSTIDHHGLRNFLNFVGMPDRDKGDAFLVTAASNVFFILLWNELRSPARWLQRLSRRPPSEEPTGA